MLKHDVYSIMLKMKEPPLRITKFFLLNNKEFLPALRSGKNIISRAIEDNNLKLIKFLFSSGLDIKDDVRSPYITVATRVNNLEILKFLLDKGFDIETADNLNTTSLNWACYNSLNDIAFYLIDRGADINSKDNEGRTPLIWAAFRGNLDLVKYLLDKGADPTIRDEKEKKAIHYANKYGYSHIFDLLVKLEEGYRLQELAGLS